MSIILEIPLCRISISCENKYLQDFTSEAHVIKALNNRFALDTAKNRGAIIENAVAVGLLFRRRGVAQHAFTVFGGDRYQETTDKKSWERFTESFADTLKN